MLKGIEKHGFEVVAEFDAPAGLRGFAGVVGGQQPAAAYVTADGKYVLVGSLFDAEGNDVAAEAVEKLVAAPMSAKMWAAGRQCLRATARPMHRAWSIPSVMPTVRTATSSGKRHGRGSMLAGAAAPHHGRRDP